MKKEVDVVQKSQAQFASSQAEGVECVHVNLKTRNKMCDLEKN